MAAAVGLVDDAQHVQTGDHTCVLRRLPLRVTEVGRHRNDRIGDRLANVQLRNVFHARQYGGSHLLRLKCTHLPSMLAHNDGRVVGRGDDTERPAGDVSLGGGVVESTADEAFAVEDGVGWIEVRLTLGCHTH